MKNLTKTVLIPAYCIAILATSVLAAPDKPFFNQDESTQNFLYDKGAKFRFFHFNVHPSGADAKYDSNICLTQWPSFWLHDQSEDTPSYFFQPGPIWIKPFTEYQLTLQVKVDAIEGPPPYLQTVFLDYNTDFLRSQDYPIEVTEPSKDWVKREIKFQTDAQTYEFRLFIWSAAKGLCDVHFDKIYLEQISEPRALQPLPQILLQEARVILNEEPPRELQRIQLPTDRNNYQLDFNIVWKDYHEDTFLTFFWMDESEKVLGRDLCQIYRIRGVQPKWDGLATRWTSERGRTSDKASQKLDWHFNSGKNGGASRVERMLEKPQGACQVRIGILNKSPEDGTLSIEDLSVIAAY